MPRPSSIKKLPPEIQSTIETLRASGWTIEQIREHLVGLLDRAPSRSALGRHIQGLDKIGEKLRRSRVITETFIGKFGHERENKIARMNIELLHSAILDVMLRATEEDGTVTRSALDALAGDPEGLYFLARAQSELAKASKGNEDFIAAAIKREVESERARNMKVVEGAAKSGRITQAALAEIRRGIYGLPPPEPVTIEAVAAPRAALK